MIADVLTRDHDTISIVSFDTSIYRYSIPILFFVSDTSIPIPILDLDLSQFLIETILEILNSDTLSVFAQSVSIIFTLNCLFSPIQFSPYFRSP